MNIDIKLSQHIIMGEGHTRKMMINIAKVWIMSFALKTEEVWLIYEKICLRDSGGDACGACVVLRR